MISKKKKKVIYISGPITGIPNSNYEAFEEREKYLQKKGYDTVNPLKKKSEVLYLKLRQAGKISKRLFWTLNMRDDIRIMMDCDAISLLPGWRKSQGAPREVYIAKFLDFKFIGGANEKRSKKI